MEMWKDAKVELQFNVEGELKPAIQSFSDLKEEHTEADVLAIGKLFDSIAPQDHRFQTAVVTNRVTYVPQP